MKRGGWEGGVLEGSRGRGSAFVELRSSRPRSGWRRIGSLRVGRRFEVVGRALRRVLGRDRLKE